MTSVDESDWIPLEGFPGYTINFYGQVRREANRRILIPRLNEYGVAFVGMMRDWQQCNRSLARLVACTFLGSPTDIFNTPIQLDGDPLNCRADNIMWRPRWYAVKYKRQFNEPYRNPINEPIHAIDHSEKFPNSFEAARRYGLLEEEVVLAIVNNTRTWPTYQEFELVEMA